jgi:teichuronic acid exporter
VALLTTIIGAIIAPPIYFFASRYGILGLSAAWLITTPILFTLNMFRAGPIVGLSLRAVTQEIWRPIVVSAAMLLSVAALRELLGGLSEIAAIGPLIACGACIYVAGSWLLNRAAFAEALSLLFPKRFGHFAPAR